MKVSTMYKSLAGFYAGIGILYSVCSSLVMKQVMKHEMFTRPADSKVPKVLWAIGRNVISNVPSIVIMSQCGQQIQENLKAAADAEEENHDKIKEQVDDLYNQAIKAAKEIKNMKAEDENDLDDEVEDLVGEIKFNQPSFKLNDETAKKIADAPSISIDELEEKIDDDGIPNLFDE